MKSCVSAAFVLVLASIIDLASAQTPEPVKKIIDQLKTCYETDKPKWDQCLVEYINALQPYLATGVPEMAIPQLEPTIIDRADFPPDSTLLQGKAALDSLVVKGLSNYTMKDSTTDVPKQLVKLKFIYPSLNVDGHYDFDGTMLVLPIKGDGRVTLNFTNVDCVLTWHIERDGTGVRLAKIDVDFEAEKIVFRLENLLGGEEVGEAINNLINDNSQEMIKELKPVLNAKLAEAVGKVLAIPVKQLPAEPFIMP